MPEKKDTMAVLDRVRSMGDSLISLLSGLLAAFLILYSSYVLYDTFYTQDRAFNSTWDLLQYKPEIIEDGATPLSGRNTLADILEDYRAWLTIYDTHIDYPVMQGPDDLYYASHDVYGESSLTGSIYLAAANSPDFSDSYNMIYGHHMDNSAMFGELDKFLKEDFFEQHREGILVTPIGVFELKTFAVITTDAYESKVYTVGDRMTEVLDFLKNPDEKTEVVIFRPEETEGAEKIVAMSTCASAETNGRLVVFATMHRVDLLKLDVESYVGVYDGRPHGVSATPSIDNGTVVEYSLDGETWTTEIPTGTDVGRITVYIRATNPYYGSATGTATITITPAPVVVTARDASKVYGSPDPEFTADVTGLLDNTRIEYELNRVGGDENVGTYNDVIVPSGASLQGNYSVTYVPADFTITPSSALTVIAGGYDGVYDGENHPGSGSSNVPDGTVIEYSTDGGKTWTTTPPSIHDVGSSDFLVRATNPNYYPATDSGTLTVTPAPAVVTAQNSSKAYGDPDPVFSAVVTGVVDGFEIRYNLTRPSGEEAVGSYPRTIIASGEALQGNYSVTYVPGNFTITAAEDELSVVGTDYYGVYDGRPHYAEATANIMQGTTIQYSTDGVTWSVNPPSITGVGSITVYVRATNPTYGTATDTLTLTVVPAPVVVAANPATKVFGAQDPRFTATVNGVVDGFNIQYTVARTGNDEAVGSYPNVIVPTGAANQGNYTVTYVPAAFTITPTTGLDLTAQGYEGVYDGETHSVIASSQFPGTVIVYSTDGGKTWTTTPPSITDVGRQEVLVRATNPNYESVQIPVILQITPRTVTVTAQSASKLYGNHDPEFYASVDGVVDDFQIEYSISRPGAGTDEAVGRYEDSIIVNGPANQGNYTVVYIPGNFTIINNHGEGGNDPDPKNGDGGNDPEPEDIGENDTPLVTFFNRFTPNLGGTPAWALVNLLCLIATFYLLLPILHLRDKFGRSKVMEKLNESENLLRKEEELEEDEEQTLLMINRKAVELREQEKEDATEETVAAAVRTAEAEGFPDVTEEEFKTAVDVLFYQIKKFLKRLRIGTGLEAIDAIVALIVFILTEDMRLPMVLIDKWTPLMILFLVICWVLDVRLARYREEVLADEEEEKQDEDEKEPAMV